MPYQLVRDDIPREDVVEALEALLEAARDGQVTGIAFACTLRGMRYMTNVAGACYKNPTFARGIVCALDDQLASLIMRKDPSETR